MRSVGGQMRMLGLGLVSDVYTSLAEKDMEF